MITVKINGGLGNQMFQYAAGRAIALRTDTALEIETSFFQGTLNEGEYKRKFQLKLFPNIAELNLKEISPKNYRKQRLYEKNIFYKTENFLRKKIGVTAAYEYIWERDLLTYEPTFHQQAVSAKLVYLVGNWQNEKYFQDFESTIRHDFVFPAIKSDSLNNTLMKQIQDTESVSVHVRRSDYLLAGIHSPVSTEYYQKALQLMQQKLESPNYFVFSDDIAWCRENLGLQNACFIEHNVGDTSYRDMQLMSSCKHNIIANSSFSWWGAWLNQYSSKIVVAPENWLVNPLIKTENIVPKNWQIL